MQEICHMNVSWREGKNAYLQKTRETQFIFLVTDFQFPFTPPHSPSFNILRILNMHTYEKKMFLLLGIGLALFCEYLFPTLFYVFCLPSSGKFYKHPKMLYIIQTNRKKTQRNNFLILKIDFAASWKYLPHFFFIFRPHIISLSE